MCYASGHTLKNHTFVVGLCKCCVAFREEAHSFFEPIFAQLHCVPATLSCRAAEGLGTWTRKLLRLKNNCLCWVIFQADQSPGYVHHTAAQTAEETQVWGTGLKQIRPEGWSVVRGERMTTVGAGKDLWRWLTLSVGHSARNQNVSSSWKDYLTCWCLIIEVLEVDR